MKTTTIASTLLTLTLLFAGGSAFAADDMSKDSMKKDSMSKDAMGKDDMKP